MERYTVMQYTPKSFQEADLDRFRELYSQLYSSTTDRTVFTKPGMREFFASGSMLYVARTEAGHIVAVGTLISNRKLSPAESFLSIQDIVTDEKYRGKVCLGNQSLAERILLAMIEYGKQKRFKYLELTSAPKRIAANKLYQRFGFKLLASGETNLYRLYTRFN